MANKSNSASQIISTLQGGGALHGIGETFAPDLHTGTGNFTVPIALLAGRNGFQPQLSLIYSTGNGNGPYGLGWNLTHNLAGQLGRYTATLKTTLTISYGTQKEITIMSTQEQLHSSRRRKIKRGFVLSVLTTLVLVTHVSSRVRSRGKNERENWLASSRGPIATILLKWPIPVRIIFLE